MRRLGADHTEPDVSRILIAGRAYERDDDGHILPVPSMDELRDLWTLLGPELLEQHIAERPGTRPWGWWQFACPLAPIWEWQLWLFGTPNGVRSRNRNEPSAFLQRQHLARHGLLQATEHLP